VPLIYWPYLSFPLSDRRKSGFLVPEFGQSTRSGFEFSAPYYVNLAPNYDYLVTPTLLSKRGLDLANEFRYLTERSRGDIALNHLYRDSELPDNDSRTWFQPQQHVTRLDNGWRLTADLEDVSDTDYFQDLGRSPQVTSRTHVERLLQADYTGTIWRMTARVQNFRTLDLASRRTSALMPACRRSWPAACGGRPTRPGLAAAYRGRGVQRDVGAEAAGACWNRASACRSRPPGFS
jgi:LPS-assembly protein